MAARTSKEYEVICAPFCENGIKYFLMIDFYFVEDKKSIVIYEKCEEGCNFSPGITIWAEEWKFFQSEHFKDALKRAIELLNDVEAIEKINTEYHFRRMFKDVETENELFELILDKRGTSNVYNEKPDYLQGVRFLVSNRLHFYVHLTPNSSSGKRFYYELIEQDPICNSFTSGFNWQPNLWKFSVIMEKMKTVIGEWLLNETSVCEQLEALRLHR